jgi:hypothetical protein
MNSMVTYLTQALAPHWNFPQHEQHHKNYTYHAVLYLLMPLCLPFGFSKFAQNEHPMPIPTRKWCWGMLNDHVCQRNRKGVCKYSKKVVYCTFFRYQEADMHNPAKF